MLLVKNKKASFEYELSQKITAGVVLSGQEVKSLRLKHASLSGSYVKILGFEAFLLNAQINPYSYADTREYDPKRTRKLLLTKKQIWHLAEKTQQAGWALVPLAFITEGNKIKLEIGLGKGKKLHDKRRAIKERDQKRNLARQRKDLGF